MEVANNDDKSVCVLCCVFPFSLEKDYERRHPRGSASLLFSSSSMAGTPIKELSSECSKCYPKKGKKDRTAYRQYISSLKSDFPPLFFILVDNCCCQLYFFF